jgi:hypothetical protein
MNSSGKKHLRASECQRAKKNEGKDKKKRKPNDFRFLFDSLKSGSLGLRSYTLEERPEFLYLIAIRDTALFRERHHFCIFNITRSILYYNLYRKIFFIVIYIIF